MIALPNEDFFVIGSVPITDPKMAKMYANKISPIPVRTRTPKKAVKSAKKRGTRQRGRRATRREGEVLEEPFGEEIDDPNVVNPFAEYETDEEWDDDEVAVSRFF